MHECQTCYLSFVYALKTSNFGAFREGRVFSNFEGISGLGVKPPNAWFIKLKWKCFKKPIFIPNVDL